jgi:hypothetical protein
MKFFAFKVTRYAVLPSNISSIACHLLIYLVVAVEGDKFHRPYRFYPHRVEI